MTNDARAAGLTTTHQTTAGDPSAGLPATEHLDVRDDGRIVATAAVRTPAPGTVNAQFHVEAGRPVPGAESQLVDSVLDLPQVHDCDRLTAAVPRGDGELLGRLRERYADVDVRAAGATTLVEASSGPTDLHA